MSVIFVGRLLTDSSIDIIDDRAFVQLRIRSVVVWLGCSLTRMAKGRHRPTKTPALSWWRQWRQLGGSGVGEVGLPPPIVKNDFCHSGESVLDRISSLEWCEMYIWNKCRPTACLLQTTLYQYLLGWEIFARWIGTVAGQSTPRFCWNDATGRRLSFNTFTRYQNQMSPVELSMKSTRPSWALCGRYFAWAPSGDTVLHIYVHGNIWRPGRITRITQRPHVVLCDTPPSSWSCASHVATTANKPSQSIYS